MLPVVAPAACSPVPSSTKHLCCAEPEALTGAVVRCLPQVMEVLDTSRAAAMELLAEHAGSAERVINEFFGA